MRILKISPNKGMQCTEYGTAGARFVLPVSKPASIENTGSEQNMEINIESFTVTRTFEIEYFHCPRILSCLRLQIQNSYEMVVFVL